MPDLNSLIYIIAQEQGLFAEAGVEVELVKFTSANTRDAALHAGEIDGAVSDVLAALFAIDGGFPVKATWLTEVRYALLASPSSGITFPEEMRGKRVAISKNTIIDYATDQLLLHYNVDPQQLRKTSIPQVPVRMQMLASGRIDAACLPDPLATAAELGGAVVVSDTLQVHITPSVMVFRTASLREKGEELKRVIAAYNQAATLINSTPASQWLFAYEAMGFPEMTWTEIQLPHYRQAQPPIAADVERVYHWMRDRGLITGTYGYSDIVDSFWLD